MDDSKLKRAALKVASVNPKFREALVRELSATKTASSASLEQSITHFLMRVVTEVGNHIKSQFPESIKGFGRPYDAGYMEAGIESDIVNRSGSPGHIMLFGECRDLRRPTVRVSASFPRAKPYERTISFLPTTDSSRVGKNLGKHFADDLDAWIVGIVSEFNRKQANPDLTSYALRQYDQSKAMGKDDKDAALILAATVGKHAKRLGMSEKDLSSWLQGAYGKVWVIKGGLNPGADLKEIRATMIKAFRK